MRKAVLGPPTVWGQSHVLPRRPEQTCSRGLGFGAAHMNMSNVQYVPFSTGSKGDGMGYTHQVTSRTWGLLTQFSCCRPSQGRQNAFPHPGALLHWTWPAPPGHQLQKSNGTDGSPHRKLADQPVPRVKLHRRAQTKLTPVAQRSGHFRAQKQVVKPPPLVLGSQGLAPPDINAAKGRGIDPLFWLGGFPYKNRPQKSNNRVPTYSSLSNLADLDAEGATDSWDPLGLINQWLDEILQLL